MPIHPNPSHVLTVCVLCAFAQQAAATSAARAAPAAATTPATVSAPDAGGGNASGDGSGTGFQALQEDGEMDEDEEGDPL